MGLLLPFSCLCGIMTGYYTACSRIRQLVGIDEEAENAHILEAAKKLWGELNHRTY